MEPTLLDLLAELEREGQAVDAVETDHSRKRLNLERPTASLLSLFARASGATKVLEIGTSNGYSAIWLAWAVAPAGGRVLTIDRSEQKHALARAAIERSGFQHSIELRNGDATALVADLPGPFDLVFFDADRTSAPDQLRILLPKLAPRVLLIADNAHSHPGEIAAYLAMVGALPGFAHSVIAVGKGLSIACRSGM
jgi:predicted O-methyltransferase YrrM